MLRTLLAIAALLLSALAAAPASAQDTASTQRQVTAGVMRDWPPEYSLDDQGEPAGFAVDIMDAVAERAGLEVTYRVYDRWSDLLRALRTGEVDVIPNLGITDSRRRDFTFAGPVETFALRVFVRADSTSIQSIGDLEGRIVAVTDTNRAREILAERQGLELEVFPDARTAFYELLAGGVDAFAYPGPVVHTMARKTGVDDRIRALDPSLEEVKRGIAVRKDDGALLAELEPAVDALLDSPEYSEIYAAWYGKPSRFWNTTRVSWLVLALLGGVLGLFLVWRARTRGIIGEEARRRRRAETRFRELMEHASDAIFLADGRGDYVDVNSAACELAGYSREELLRMNARDLLFPEDVERRPPDLERVASEGRLLSERRLRRKDGSAAQIELGVARVGDGLILGIARDVSERKRAEAAFREQQEMLRQAQKMEAIGRLAGGVAHDFNNLLTAIVGYADLLMADASPTQRPEVEEIREAADRGTALTRQLLAFSRRQVLQSEVLDLARVTDGMRKILHRLLGEDVRLAVEHGDERICVEADRGQMEQVLMNLAVNARDAMSEGGDLIIRIDRVQVDPSIAERHGGRRDWALLSVRDTGAGMDEEVRARIFEPFFTTKPHDKGTGLGLATVLGIVEQSGGWIEVDSEPGRGTEFRIHLPSCEPPATSERPAPPGEDAAAAPASGTVMVAEDQPAVRNLIERTLRRAGYDVHAASSGEEALGLAEELDGSLDLLVTDVVMPGINGPDLAARLAERYAGLAVLFASGYADAQLDDVVLEQPRRAFVGKPFTPSELLAEVRELLG